MTTASRQQSHVNPHNLYSHKSLSSVVLFFPQSSLEHDVRKHQASRRCVDCPAIEGLKEVKEIDGGKISIQLAKEWEHVVSKIGDDDPVALVIWDDDNVDSTVAALNGAVQQGAAPPSWLTTVPITRQDLKIAILDHVRTNACGNQTEVVGNALLGPNNLAEFTRIAQELGYIGSIPLFQNHAVGPIGRLFVIADRKAKTIAVPNPLSTNPIGAQVFV